MRKNRVSLEGIIDGTSSSHIFVLVILDSTVAKVVTTEAPRLLDFDGETLRKDRSMVSEALNFISLLLLHFWVTFP